MGRLGYPGTSLTIPLLLFLYLTFAFPPQITMLHWTTTVCTSLPVWWEMWSCWCRMGYMRTASTNDFIEGRTTRGSTKSSTCVMYSNLLSSLLPTPLPRMKTISLPLASHLGSSSTHWRRHTRRGGSKRYKGRGHLSAFQVSSLSSPPFFSCSILPIALSLSLSLSSLCFPLSILYRSFRSHDLCYFFGPLRLYFSLSFFKTNYQQQET